ncbi:MAG: 30S ribosomal protein S2 [bacterium]
MKDKLPSLEELLKAGVHFGHKKERWNPKMQPFIFSIRDNTSIIDLDKTQEYLQLALNYIEKLISDNKIILFVGTKKQVQDLIAQVENFDLPYINNRWLGGTLTNFETIKKNLQKIKKLEKEQEQGGWKELTKFEQTKKTEELKKLIKKFGGIKNLEKLPDALFVVDTNREKVAIHEARNLDIPIIALVDSNSNPDEITCPIPANDDAVRSLELILGVFFDKIKEVQAKTKKTSKKTDKSRKSQKEKNKDEG